MDLFTNQLKHVFDRLSYQHDAFDRIATVLAQAAIAEGTIFIAAFGEMKAVTAVALNGTQLLPAVAEWSPASIVTHIDRVWILAAHEEGDELAGRLSDAGIPFAVVSAQSTNGKLADAFLFLNDQENTFTTDENNPRVVPYAMTALYIYYAVAQRIHSLLLD
ncbi:DUF2529 family protein [Planococcus versutus]|uniref:DUF2529 domain-containing protein n=1 Tax=Planococcus versutus TaxID=1302659 RepID=A0A1B1S2P3_9BACL|nr:DUF2529 family protein [Planococcus versutus]ANU27455.1 hypothetical protein I858_010690 [Planococcus versutus]